MKKGKSRTLRFVLSAGLFVFLSPLAFSQPAATERAGKTEAEPKIEIAPRSSTFPIREEVRILRAERKKKMPYLDRRYVHQTISPQALEAKRAFTQKDIKTLSEVISRSIEVYTPIKAARERIALARRRIVSAARELLPGGSFNFELRKGSLSQASFSGQDYHVTFRIPVFRGGILWNTLLREKADYRAAKKEYDAVVNELIDEVSKAYFEYNRTREVFKGKTTLAEKSGKQGGISKQKFDEALISEIEYLNVESMVGQLKYEIETAEQELELAKLELQRFLDLDIGEDIAIASLYDLEDLVAQAAPEAPGAPSESEGKSYRLPQSLEEFVDLAYQNRPELRVEAEKLRSAALEELIARGPFLGRVDLLTEFGELGEAFILDADDPTHRPEWRLGLEASSNLFGNKVKYTFDNDQNAPSVSQFLQGTGSQITRRKMEIGFLDGLEEYADLKEAQVKKLEQVIELEKKEREVIREVKEAYFDYHKARVQMESSLKRNQYRERLVKLNLLRLEKAEIEISEYLQSEIDLSEERGRMHQALADLFKAKSKLNRAIGIRDYVPMEERYGA